MSTWEAKLSTILVEMVYEIMHFDNQDTGLTKQERAVLGKALEAIRQATVEVIDNNVKAAAMYEHPGIIWIDKEELRTAIGASREEEK